MASHDLQSYMLILEKNILKEKLTDKISNCLKYAFEKHLGQYRVPRLESQARLPYIVHPLGVALIADQYYHSLELNDSYEDVIMSALCHDLLEDTDSSFEELSITCSVRVAEIVKALTKPDVLPNETNKERNERFIEQIISSGTTGMYIKICDSMHNISQPKNTPTNLMRKAISKARRHYMKFFNQERLVSMILESTYNNSVNTATRDVQKLETETKGIKIFDISEVIKETILSRELKSLELHDIMEMIENLSHSSIMMLSSSSEVFDKLFLEPRGIDQKSKAFLEKKIREGHVQISDIPRKYRKLFLKHTTEVFLIHTSLNLIQDTLIVGFDENCKPKWTDLYTLQMLFTLLSEKLRHSHKKNQDELSSYASSLGIDLTSQDLEMIHLEQKDLKNLSFLLNSADHLMFSIGKELKTYLLSCGFNPEYLKKRLKTPRSILKKAANRKSFNLSNIDDILGFRFSSVNKRNQILLAEKIIYFFEVLIPEKFNYSVKSQGSSSPLASVESRAGYKALHLSFWINIEKSDSLPVSCEIQLRTFFQDAWSEVSNNVYYKSNSTRLIEEKLQELAVIRDKADIILDQI